MAFNKAPSAWLSGYTANDTANSITLNTASAATPSFPELTNAEANATTGDIRKVIYAVMEQIYQTWSAKETADRPAKVSINRSSQVGSDNSITHQYIVSVNVSGTSFEVTNEPPTP